MPRFWGGGRLDWYLRASAQDPWVGPFPFRVADEQARRATMNGTPTNVLYMQLGTFLGARKGDPIVDPHVLFVDRIYINGKFVLGGRQANLHRDLLPPVDI